MKKITIKELNQLEKDCLSRIESEHLYNLRNDAKIRAVVQSKNYEEFK